MKGYGNLDKYDRLDNRDEFRSISEELIEASNAQGKTVEQDPDKLKHLIKNDLRDNIPARLYALIGLMTSKIESIEKQSHR